MLLIFSFRKTMQNMKSSMSLDWKHEHEPKLYAKAIQIIFLKQNCAYTHTCTSIKQVSNYDYNISDKGMPVGVILNNVHCSYLGHYL
jgi:hypothetical protein